MYYVTKNKTPTKHIKAFILRVAFINKLLRRVTQWVNQNIDGSNLTGRRAGIRG